jgi:hypothetical protein
MEGGTITEEGTYDVRLQHYALSCPWQFGIW